MLEKRDWDVYCPPLFFVPWVAMDMELCGEFLL